MKKLVMLAAMFAVANFAVAAQTNTGCQGNCPSTGGDTVNQRGVGYGGAGGVAYGGSGVGLGGQGGQGGLGGQGGAGGQGGQGGAGGSVNGSGNSSASGGAVVGSGNSHNELSQGQGQSQSNRQGQSQSANNKQSQSNSSRNDNNSNAANTNSNTNNGNNSSQATQVGGDTYVSNYRAATSSAYAPPIAPTAVCMGSSSAGGTGMSFGFSIGTSWTDSNCMLLEQVRTVAVALADKETAAAMMCSVEAYREARKNTAKPCQ